VLLCFISEPGGAPPRGTILSQPRLYDAFAAALAEAVPGARPQPLRLPPVEGAVALARSIL
ncbi:hypothetical protein ACFV23_31895, partial [Streptomyces sp. NPDC059627]